MMGLTSFALISAKFCWHTLLSPFFSCAISNIFWAFSIGIPRLSRSFFIFFYSLFIFLSISVSLRLLELDWLEEELASLRFLECKVLVWPSFSEVLLRFWLLLFCLSLITWSICILSKKSRPCASFGTPPSATLQDFYQVVCLFLMKGSQVLLRTL